MAGAYDLVVVSAGRSLRRAVDVSALVAVLVEGGIHPGACPVGDRFVGLVADEADLRVGGRIAVGGLGATDRIDAAGHRGHGLVAVDDPGRDIGRGVVGAVILIAALDSNGSDGCVPVSTPVGKKTR